MTQERLKAGKELLKHIHYGAKIDDNGDFKFEDLDEYERDAIISRINHSEILSLNTSEQTRRKQVYYDLTGYSSLCRVRGNDEYCVIGSIIDDEINTQ